MAEKYDVEWNTKVNKWSSKNKPQVGDTLVFEYEPLFDSVMQVNKEDYESCQPLSPPIATYCTGKDSVNLCEDGEYYFMSGNPANCKDGEKLKIKVKDSKDREAEGGEDGASADLTSNGFTIIMLGLAFIFLL
ncbi:hypothetical protein ACH5RR_013349 [Cinchona calisaya]|uniref:Phytocyanin domain-containing protein n=1 Tax=Cinchona calisaya TaxID=153742 RepID=A0ABD3A2F2_9GENT